MLSCRAGFASVLSKAAAVGVRVLLVATNDGDYDNGRFLQDVRSKLLATGAFAAVDVFDASYATPLAVDLQDYAAVLVWNWKDFASASGVGDALAQYWDGGGAVVVATFANADSRLQGRFGTAANGYILIDGTAGWDHPSDSLGEVAEPQSLLMAGVARLSSGYARHSTGAVVNGGVVVARWASNGRPLVVRGSRAGRPLAALNMWPVSQDVWSDGWSGDGALLVRNALLYSLCSTCTAGAFTTAGERGLVE